MDKMLINKNIGIKNNYVSRTLKIINHELLWRIKEKSNIKEDVIRREDNYEGWVFLCGINNSGTSLMQKLLSKHKSISTLGNVEGQAMTVALPKPKNVGVERLWTQEIEKFRWKGRMNEEKALRVKYDWLECIDGQGKLIFEKSPPNTVRSLWLQENFKKPRFIVTSRHPYAVCEGIVRRENASISAAAEHYKNVHNTLIGDMKNLNNCFFYKYEKLCDNPRVVLDKISNFLCIEKEKKRDRIGEVRSHSIDGSTKGIKNLNKKSIKRLTKSEIKKINNILGNLIIKLGYSKKV
jgi:hypothetical protein